MESNNKRFSLSKNWELVNFCEFDQYATKSYCAIHDIDERLNLGDIVEVDETKLKDFDMMTWGFPCTDISVAGKQKGFLDENGNKTRSGMYYEGIRILRYKRPAISIIENVKNLTSKRFKSEFETVLKDLDEAGYNSYYKVLNAKDFGVPQNRERVLIVSIRKDLDNGKFVFPEGFDNGIRLKDILENEVDEKYYISDDKVQKFLNQLINNTKDKEKDINNHTPIRLGNVYGEQFGTGYAGNVWDTNAISPALMTMQGGGRQPHVVCSIDKSTNKIKQIGKLSSSQDGVVVDPEGIAKTHTAGHNNTPKIIQIGIDKSINETRIGFKYDYDLDDYVYKFPVYSYKNIPLVFCKLGIDEETKRVWLGVYDANNVMYSSYYDREYGKNSIIKNIEKAISKELNKLGVKKVN